MENKNDIFNKNPKNNKQKMFKFNLYWMYGLIFLMLFALYLTNDSSASKELGWTEFQKLAQENVFDRMVVYNKKNLVEATVKDGRKGLVFRKDSATLGTNPKVYVKIPSADKFSDFYDKAVAENHITTQVSFEEGDDAIWNFLVSFGPILLIIVVWIFLMRRMSGGATGGPGGVFSVGKAKAQLFDKDNDRKVTFKDVAGLAEAKQEVEEIVSFLKSPEKYTELGGKIPKGALLVGPPGTGKTLLAKAVAGEADVPFFSLSGSDFVEMFVGVGASRVRDLFKQAKEKAPCIVFIDEIDAVGRARGKNPAMGGNDERENTLNQLLTEMDGFGSNSGVIILAATNRVDVLDKALLRAGRFDRQITVDLPDLTERKEIFQVHLRKVKIDETVDIDFLSRQTPGFSGADIANVCNEAALIAARHNSNKVGKQDFLDAVDRIIGGLEKKTKVMTESEKRTIALHEAGHATVSWFCEHANPLVKVSIVPRGRALGAAWYLPEERQITTKEQMLDEMCALLGGRAAEELFTGHISTGAMNDLERATKSAFGMVAYAGMSDRLPNICYYNNQEYQFQRPYSETTAKIIDDEVLKMVNDEYARAKALLKEHAAGHNELAELLMTREVIFAEDVERIFGKRPWVSRSEEIIDDNTPKLEDMPEAVRQAQKEHEESLAKQAALPTDKSENTDVESVEKPVDPAENAADDAAEQTENK